MRYEVTYLISNLIFQYVTLDLGLIKINFEMVFSFGLWFGNNLFVLIFLFGIHLQMMSQKYYDTLKKHASIAMKK